MKSTIALGSYTDTFVTSAIWEIVAVIFRQNVSCIILCEDHRYNLTYELCDPYDYLLSINCFHNEWRSREKSNIAFSLMKLFR